MKDLYTKETNWGTHFVTAGFGKYSGKFLAQSIGAGGARGYFIVCESLEDAVTAIEKNTAPLPESDRIRL